MIAFALTDDFINWWLIDAIYDGARSVRVLRGYVSEEEFLACPVSIVSRLHALIKPSRGLYCRH
jgi:hypothetical protein